MKYKPRSLANRWMLLLILGTVFGGALLAQQDSGEFFVFGLGRGQTCRFAVTAGGRVPCHAMLGFRDTQNRPLGPSREVTVGPHEAAFLELDPGGLELRTRQRVSFRPVLTPFPDSGPCRPSLSLLEIFTRRLVGFASGCALTKGGCILEAPPCSPASLLDPYVTSTFLGFGQTVELWVVRSTTPVDANNLPFPCDAVLNIRNSAGNILLASVPTGPLLPGHAAKLSLNSSSLNLNLGNTAFLNLEVAPAAVVNILFPNETQPCPVTSHIGCKPSVQVIDTLTLSTLATSVM